MLQLQYNETPATLFCSRFWLTGFLIGSFEGLPKDASSHPDSYSTNYLTSWSRGRLEKLTVAELFKKFLAVMKPYVHRSPPLGPLMSQMSPVHTLISYLFKIHFGESYIMPIYAEIFQVGSLIQVFRLKLCMYHVLSMHRTCPVQLIFLDLIMLITFREAYSTKIRLQPSSISFEVFHDVLLL
jgi:hypothetical protein